MHNLSEKINESFEREKWAEARDLIVEELKQTPNDHWLLSRLSTTYYEQKDYKKALHIAKKALKNNPDCPLVMWDLAGALFATGNARESFKIYRDLLIRGHEEIARGPCGEGEQWAVSLLIDCIFRMANCHQELGENDRAISLLVKFLQLRAEWKKGIYSLEDGVCELEDIVKKMSHSHKRSNPESAERKLGEFSRELITA